MAVILQNTPTKLWMLLEEIKAIHESFRFAYSTDTIIFVLSLVIAAVKPNCGRKTASQSSGSK
jgi:hypothetical protein